MQSVGPETLGQMYDHLIEQTQSVAVLIDSHPDFELLEKPSLSTVLFRVVGQEPDVLNQKLRLEALVRGVAVLGETTVKGKTALKLTILNPCLKMSDFESLIEKIANLAAELMK
jgi:diaminobutyrate-2-oxoglutarate transaminase